MNDLLQKVLTDASTRSATQLPLTAASTSNTFVPWSSGLDV
jgi:hypothetical protein